MKKKNRVQLLNSCLARPSVSSTTTNWYTSMAAVSRRPPPSSPSSCHARSKPSPKLSLGRRARRPETPAALFRGKAVSSTRRPRRSPVAAALLEGPPRGSLEGAHPPPDPGDRRGGRRPEVQNGKPAIGDRGHSGSTSPRSSEAPEEIARSAVPYGELQGAARALGSLRLVPSPPFPGRGGETAGGRSPRGVSAGRFPPALPFVGGSFSPGLADHRLWSELLEGAGARCVQRAVSAEGNLPKSTTRHALGSFGEGNCLEDS